MCILLYHWKINPTEKFCFSICECVCGYISMFPKWWFVIPPRTDLNLDIKISDSSIFLHIIGLTFFLPLYLSSIIIPLICCFLHHIEQILCPILTFMLIKLISLATILLRIALSSLWKKNVLHFRENTKIILREWRISFDCHEIKHIKIDMYFWINLTFRIDIVNYICYNTNSELFTLI